MIQVKFEEKWSEALRLLHKFCPHSRSQILSLSDFHMDPIYGVFKSIDSSFLDKRYPYDTGKNSETLVRDLIGDEFKLENERVLAIHDLGYWVVPPIICKADRLLERISEGVSVDGSGKKVSEFIDGGDTFFAFETTGKLLMFDHDHYYCLVDPSWKR